MKKQDPKSRLLEKTADTLMNEICKPEDEVNWELVELCEKILVDFSDYKKPSDEEIKSRVQQITDRVEREKKADLRRASFVRVFAAVAACFVLTVCAVLFVNGRICENNAITYIENGEKTVYRTLNDLLEAENLDFFYPQEIAYDARITEVRRDGANQTVFVFDDPRLSFEVYHDDSDDPSQNNSGAIDFFNLLSSTECSYLYFSINNDEYALSCDSRELLDEMMDSFNFER